MLLKEMTNWALRKTAYIMNNIAWPLAPHRLDSEPSSDLSPGPWSVQLSSLCRLFFICKLQTVVVPTAQGYYEG